MRFYRPTDFFPACRTLRISIARERRVLSAILRSSHDFGVTGPFEFFKDLTSSMRLPVSISASRLDGQPTRPLRYYARHQETLRRCSRVPHQQPPRLRTLPDDGYPQRGLKARAPNGLIESSKITTSRLCFNQDALPFRITISTRQSVDGSQARRKARQTTSPLTLTLAYQVTSSGRHRSAKRSKALQAWFFSIEWRIFAAKRFLPVRGGAQRCKQALAFTMGDTRSINTCEAVLDRGIIDSIVRRSSG